jgi:hypothetical protein
MDEYFEGLVERSRYYEQYDPFRPDMKEEK